MNLSVFKVVVNVVGITSLLGSAYLTVKVWTDKSELGQKMKVQLKEEISKLK
jgi:hypothetical protein